MEVKKEPNLCRMCYTQVVEYFDIFENTASIPNIVCTLKQYFDDEVNDSDILPKVICIKCWDRIESFRKFSEEVIALREKYLRQNLNSAVKNENFEEYMTTNFEPEIHQEMVCVDPLRPIKMLIEEEEDENMELEESKLHYESMDERRFSYTNDTDDDNEVSESNELPVNTEGMHLPQHISEVSPEKQQQIIDQYFDMSCDFCEVKFQTCQEATQHYRVNHKNEPRGYVKCCSMNLPQLYDFNYHIVWHLNPELFKCQICGVTKKTPQLYAQHKSTHTNQFTCDICQAKFTKKSSVDRHIHEVHVMKRNYPCDKCHETFKTQKRLQYHVKMTHSKGVNLDDYIEEVKKIEYNPSEMQVKSVMDKHFESKCDLCDTELDTLTMAKSHYLAKHKNPNGYLRCCNYKLTHNSMFLEHIQWHIDSNIFRCRLCNTASKCRYNLLRHVKKHKIVSTKQFMCNICDQYFGTFSQHRIHMERKHSEMQPNSSPVETNPNENNGDLKNDIEIPIYADASCDLCPATTFNSFYEMQSHYLDIHSAAYGNVKCCESKFFTFPQFRDHIAWHNDPNIFRCGVCNKSLPNRRTLLRHNDLHANKFQCDVCHRSFGSTNHLKQHMNTHKARETLKRNIVCDVCHKKFRYEETMEKHRKMHTDNLRYDHICEFCAKEFKTILELKNHILKKHSTETKQPEAKLQCDVCNGWYPKSSLKAHKIKHNSEPQKCNQCDKVSPNAQALEQHIRYTHNSEANFNCHLCEKSFKLPASLRDHIATHLNNKSHKCTYCDMTFVWRQNMYKHRKLHEEWLADKGKK